ncbi:MAG: hypothetical protein O9318_11540 [Hylemonella sp.]|uniref:hypothetical protein n=1 Tax=Hylemonella sp. TaxID=2066020 RepID=UPI0022C45337|nr:hypothetical protein [Hylemonella sp.]MCZ8253094.1 hypothetical protein [Hylemonella sp.]
MSILWKALVETVTKDDLFIRVALAIFGGSAAALGLLCLSEPVGSDQSWGWSLVLWGVGFLFLAWGVLVFVAAFTPPSSRWSKAAEKFYPDPAGLDDAAFLLVVVLIPAVVVTLLLRVCGVRGYVA